MDSDPVKRCLLCGQTVPPNAVKCSSCGKGRFETEKRHTEPRPARAGTSSKPAAGNGSRPPATARPAPAAKASAPAPGGGLLARLLARLTGKR